MKYPFLDNPLRPIKEIGTEPFSSIIFKNTLDGKSVLIEVDLNLLSDYMGIDCKVNLQYITECVIGSIYRVQEWNHLTKESRVAENCVQE